MSTNKMIIAAPGKNYTEQKKNVREIKAIET